MSLKTLEDLWPVACLKANISLQVLNRSKESSKNARYRCSEGYIGIHLSEYFSLHARGQYEKLDYFGNLENDDGKARKVTDSMFVQFGNVTLTRFTASVGRIKLPFGLDRKSTIKITDRIYKNREFWSSPDFGGVVSWEDLKYTKIEVGYASNKNQLKFDDNKVKLKKGLEKIKKAYSVRLINDLAAVNGTRIILSGYEETSKERRIGAGVFYVSENESINSLEWVRKGKGTASGVASENTLVRYSYYESKKNNFRWMFEYEDEFKVHWLLTAGVDLLFTTNGVIKTNLTYVRSRISKELSHYFLAIGAEIHL